MTDEKLISDQRVQWIMNDEEFSKMSLPYGIENINEYFLNMVFAHLKANSARDILTNPLRKAHRYKAILTIEAYDDVQEWEKP